MRTLIADLDVSLHIYVGHSFIKFYYKMLFFMTENIGKLYMDDATVCIQDKIYRGPEEIQGAFIKLGFQDMQVDIKKASFVPSHNNSILIVVSGRFTSDKGGPSRLISQSFVLAEAPRGDDETSQASFVVLSDVLHCLEGPDFGEVAAPVAEAPKKAEAEVEPKAAAPKKSESSKESKEVSQDKAETPKKAEAPKKVEAEPKVEAPAKADNEPKAANGTAVAPAAEPKVSVAEPKKEKPAAKAEPVKEEPAAPAPPAPAAPAKSSETSAPATPAPSTGFSYAQMLAKPKAPVAAPAASAAAPAAAPAAAATPAAPAAAPAAGAKGKAPKAAAQANGTAAQQQQQQQGKSRREGGAQRKANSADLSKSLYVKDMPRDYNEAKIRECFSQFGEVVSVELPPGKHFAFVNFESIEGMKKAMAAEEITMEDSKVYVEARSATGGNRGGNNNNAGTSGRNGGRRGNNNNNGSGSNNNNNNKNSRGGASGRGNRGGARQQQQQQQQSK